MSFITIIFLELVLMMSSSLYAQNTVDEDAYCGRDSLTALEAYQRFNWIKNCPAALDKLLAFEKTQVSEYAILSNEDLLPVVEEKYLYVDGLSKIIREFPLYVVAIFIQTKEVWRIPGNYHTPCDDFPGEVITFRSYCRSN